MGATQGKASKAVQKGPQRSGENGFKYRPKYGLVVVCTDEAHQQTLFKKLTKMGLKLKVVCV